jgi:hypothetical protein
MQDFMSKDSAVQEHQYIVKEVFNLQTIKFQTPLNDHIEEIERLYNKYMMDGETESLVLVDKVIHNTFPDACTELLILVKQHNNYLATGVGHSLTMPKRFPVTESDFAPGNGQQRKDKWVWGMVADYCMLLLTYVVTKPDVFVDKLIMDETQSYRRRTRYKHLHKHSFQELEQLYTELVKTPSLSNLMLSLINIIGGDSGDDALVVKHRFNNSRAHVWMNYAIEDLKDVQNEVGKVFLPLLVNFVQESESGEEPPYTIQELAAEIKIKYNVRQRGDICTFLAEKYWLGECTRYMNKNNKRKR